MLENENLVLNDTENVETVTTEENTGEVQVPVKTYTQEEVDDIVGKRLARNTAKIRKEYSKKYGDLENVLKAGTGKDNVVELTDTFRSFYEQKGIHIPSEPTYSGRDIEVLAKAEATDIINAGFEEVVEEVKPTEEVKEEIINDLMEKSAEVKKTTKDEDEAYEICINSLGDLMSVIKEYKNFSK